MASPVAHALLSWAALKGAREGGVPWRGPSLLVAAALLGNLPDADLLPGLVVGSFNRWHQGMSHSLLGISLFALFAYGVARFAGGRLGPPRMAAFWCLALSAGHLLVDMMTRDPSPPVGIPLLWPLSEARAQLPILLFPNYVKPTLSALLTTPTNLTTLLLEVVVTVPAAVAAFVLARVASRRTR
jgi:membrane-bound metal-dependent hydrolase YbcI (DUF457 family)